MKTESRMKTESIIKFAMFFIGICSIVVLSMLVALAWIAIWKLL